MDRKAHRRAGASLALILSAISLSSCTSMFGNSDYGCKGMPNGVQCSSARTVYEMTTGRDSLENSNMQYVEPGKEEGRDSGSDGGAGNSGRVAAPGQRPIQPTPVTAEYGRLPIRTPAKVMRVWIAPYETEEGDLAVAGLLYVEIEPKRWQIGEPEDRQSFQTKTPLLGNSMDSPPSATNGAGRTNTAPSTTTRPASLPGALPPQPFAKP